MKLRFSQLNLGLKTKFVLTISFLILVTSVILGVSLITKQNQLIQGELKKRGESMTRNLAHNSEYGVLVESEQLLFNLMEGLFLEPEVVHISIQDKSGELLANWGRTQEYLQIYDRRQNAVGQSFKDENPSAQYFTINDKEFYYFSCPIKTTRVERSKEEVGLLYGTKDLATKEEKIGMANVGISLQNMRREIAEMTRIVVLLTVLVVAVGVLLTIFLVNIFVKPVKRLVQATERIASGDLSHMVDVTTKDEIGTLASSFNRMIISLKESREKVEEYNRTLENKVKERTAELEKTNRELENTLKSLKETQAQLIQVEKMAAVGQLAAGVAHELNNPLGGILGYSQFALEKISQKQISQFTSEDSETFLHYLKDIEQQTKRCRSIIQSLLKFSRASRKEEYESTDISAILRETFAFTRHQLQKSKVTLVEKTANSLPTINGHPSQLQQVFTNLILNAVQAMPEGGTLTVDSNLSNDHKDLEISFTDTGLGIPEGNRDKIFEPFFTTKKVGEGTGLGLSVSYGLIKNHGGEIKVHSKKNQGTTFTVILPVLVEKVSSGSKNEKELSIGR